MISMPFCQHMRNWQAQPRGGARIGKRENCFKYQTICFIYLSKKCWIILRYGTKMLRLQFGVQLPLTNDQKSFLLRYKNGQNKFKAKYSLNSNKSSWAFCYRTINDLNLKSSLSKHTNGQIKFRPKFPQFCHKFSAKKEWYALKWDEPDQHV